MPTTMGVADSLAHAGAWDCGAFVCCVPPRAHRATQQLIVEPAIK